VKYKMMKLSNEATFRLAVRATLMTGLSMAAAGQAFAQTAPATSEDTTELEAIEVTGTRIIAPGIVSASPVYSIEKDEIDLQQQPEIERIFRLLPITVPADGQNVNNGTAGAATVNLRGLGSARNLVLIDGKRLTPYSVAGLVDTSIIPIALIDRVDLITGGASAVYGSDAMSGAINIITKRDFEGLEFVYNNGITGESDGQTKASSMLLGGNFGDGRGNAVLSVNWTDRTGVQLGQRPLGQLGIETATGAGYEQFLAGTPPTPPPANCTAPNAVAAGGSSTTIPTRVSIPGSVSLGQFRNDGTLGANCSVFNFNPFNYYQTPQERFGANALGHFDITKDIEGYGRLSYTVTNVTQQVAPSGIFGDTFWTPMTNTQIGTTARNQIIAAAEAARVAGSLNATNWRDEDSSNTVTAADDILISYRRRTSELGPRSTTYTNDNFQFVTGMKASVFDTWNFDLSFSRGQTDRTQYNQGYTNVANIAQQVESEDGVNCAPGAGPTCVPINLFGGFGTITAAAAAYAGAVSLIQEKYEQYVTTAVLGGQLPVQLPSSSRQIALSYGVERRREEGAFNPDECQKLAPASCLGGAGGNSLPVGGEFRADEAFTELFVPLVDDVVAIKSLDIEAGYRRSNFTSTGESDTWKAGISWAPVDMLMVRIMQQRAVRAPNIGELFAPQVTGLDNANSDPCSVTNAANNGPGTQLEARCIATGMTSAQVGTVQDLVAGQINGFFGTDPTNPPDNEEGDSFTVGTVLTPKFGGPFRDVYVTLDYYDIEIKDYIDTYGAQEVLDACYSGGNTAQCAKIRRVAGDLVLPGSGVELYTTNLNYRQAEGIELGAGVGFGLGAAGGLKLSANVNKYLTQEFQSDPTLPVNDCLGHYSTTCRGPRPEIRWIQRTTWDFNKLQASLLWRHIGEASMTPEQLAAIEEANGAPAFAEFTSIDAYDYFDVSFGYKVLGNVRLNVMASNIFDKDPPVVGNEAADTGSNSGNTFPSQYDTLGTVYTFGMSATF
jgi:iron complex outermembrane recepter protein